jgi:hypothetical protein
MTQKQVRLLMLWGGLALTTLTVLTDFGLGSNVQKVLVLVSALLTGLGVKATQITGMVDSSDVAESEITPELTTAKDVQKAVKDLDNK